MHVHTTDPLFAWQALEDSPSLQTIQAFLQAVPDAKLLDSLRTWRGHGRNDVPVHVAWGVLLLTVALRHTGVAATLAELRRNPPLRQLIGIASESEVPNSWNLSRFQQVLGQEPHLSLLREIFDRIIQTLGSVVGDLGRNVAGDASALSARRVHSQCKVQLAAEAQLPQPNGGCKQYLDESGVVLQEYRWFGFKFHLLVDQRHEVIVAYQITSATTGDNQIIPALVEQACGNLPPGRMQTLAYDKAADDQEVHEFLDEQKIAPVIEVRSLWKEETERMLPGHDGCSNVVYDEAGTVYCYNKVSDPPVKRKMAYIGHEPARGTIKYRCPARHEGWDCPSDERCNVGRKYGKTVRIDRQQDLRRFPPIPRATKKFERLYKGRTAVERVNARVKIFWGADDGNVAGSTRFHALLGTVMVVHAGFALLLASAPRRNGTLGKMHLTPIAQALREKLRGG